MSCEHVVKLRGLKTHFKIEILRWKIYFSFCGTVSNPSISAKEKFPRVTLFRKITFHNFSAQIMLSKF